MRVEFRPEFPPNRTVVAADHVGNEPSDGYGITIDGDGVSRQVQDPTQFANLKGMATETTVNQHNQHVQ